MPPGTPVLYRRGGIHPARYLPIIDPQQKSLPVGSHKWLPYKTFCCVCSAL